MKTTIESCLFCNRGFRAGYNQKLKRKIQYCSRGCAIRARFNKVPPPSNGNGHLSLDDGLKMIRTLVNEGILNKANIKAALRRKSDEVAVL